MSVGLGPTAVVGLAGAGLAAVSSSQVWGRAELTTVAVRTLEVRGSDVAPLALPLALVALASWGAVLVLRRRGRRVVSVVGLLAALGVLAVVLVRADDVATTARDLAPVGTSGGLSVTTAAWPWTAAVGAALTACAFAAAWRLAPSWPEMSSRYDAPRAGPAAAPAAPASETRAADGETPAQLWSALDEGRDPTT